MAPNAQTVAKAIQHFLPSKLPSTLSNSPSSLYQVLSRFPRDGVGQKVYQTRWGAKGFPECYWEVTRTKLKLEGRHGKAWGHLVWRGKRTSENESKIPGGLKYTWSTGASTSGIVKPKVPLTSA